MNCFRCLHLQLRKEELRLKLPYQHQVFIGEISKRTFAAKEQLDLKIVSNSFIVDYLLYLRNNLPKASVCFFYKDMGSIMEVLGFYLNDATLTRENRTLLLQLLSQLSSIPFVFGTHLQGLLPDLQRQFSGADFTGKKEIFRIFFNLDLLSETKSYQLEILRYSIDEIQLAEQLCWGVYIYSKNPELDKIDEYAAILNSVICSQSYLLPTQYCVRCNLKLSYLLNSVKMLLNYNQRCAIVKYDLQFFLLSLLNYDNCIYTTLSVISYFLFEQQPFDLEELTHYLKQIIRFLDDINFQNTLNFLIFCCEIDIYLDCLDAFTESGISNRSEQVYELYALYADKMSAHQR